MNILDETVTPGENFSYSLKRYWIWWLILIVTIIYDYLSTTVFVAEYGVNAEANLGTRFFMINFSPHIGNLTGKLLQFLSVICFVSLNKRVGNFFLLFIILINGWAIMVNSIS